MSRPSRTAGLTAQQLLTDERGTLYKDAPVRVALVYPSPYRAAMSSLGYQQIYRTINNLPGVAADRAMLPDAAALPLAPGQPLVTLESGRPVSDYPILAYSVAYELEIAGVVETLERAGIPPLASQRNHHHPLVIAGGPLTFSNPAPMAPFFDVIVMGEGEELIVELIDIARTADYARHKVWDALAGRPGYYLPHRDGESIPPVAAVANCMLPARSVILTPHTELSNMFLTEAARGCSRGCTYCVMRRSTNGGMRIVAPDDIISGIPEFAKKVGLVGAAVTDHPHITEIVRRVVEPGRSVGISSLRADKLNDELVGWLARGGYRTLTVAADGTSERMRRVVERSTQEKHLLHSAALAKTHRLKTLKVYMMVGVPEETDDDIDELVRFSVELAQAAPHVAYGIAPFVAKRNTPLDGSPFAGIGVVEDRLERLRAGLRKMGVANKVEVRPTSARWAWVEYMLAQCESVAGLALMDAHHAGGSFAAYKTAFAAHGVTPTGPRARVPSSQELIRLNRARLASVAR
ncbi:MAG: radical SAM protein [Kofleriaceae bacterium]|nr:radical SAM protein [Kofleriaceae bacterium]